MLCQYIKGTPSKHDAQCKCLAPTDGGPWCAKHTLTVFALDGERLKEARGSMEIAAALVGRKLDTKAFIQSMDGIVA